MSVSSIALAWLPVGRNRPYWDCLHSIKGQLDQDRKYVNSIVEPKIMLSTAAHCPAQSRGGVSQHLRVGIFGPSCVTNLSSSGLLLQKIITDYQRKANGQDDGQLCGHAKLNGVNVKYSDGHKSESQ